MKASIIKRHVESSKHKSGKERLSQKKKREMSIVDAMKNYDQEVHPKGEMLSDNQRVFRVKVLETFLKAGVPLHKMDDFHELLEEGGYRLTSAPYMRQLIPFVKKEEEEKIKDEISGTNVAVIFDGTTRLGEALAIVIRFVTADWEIKQRDGASVNGAVMRTVKVVFPKVVDMRCFSHAIDYVGDHFNIPTLKRFLQLWNIHFGHSPATRLAWRERTGISIKSYSPTRWWSWWEVAQQIMLQFAEILPFVQQRLQEAGSKAATLKQIEAVLNDVQTKCSLQIELAAVVDAGKPMVESTYILEGDDALAWKCYEQLIFIQNSINVVNLPNLTAISRQISEGNPVVAQQFYQYGVAAVQPGWNYFSQTVMGTLNSKVKIFRAARLFSPQKVCSLRPVANDINAVAAISFLNDAAVIRDLNNELPRYLAKADGIGPDVDLVGWWKNNIDEPQLSLFSCSSHHQPHRKEPFPF